MGGRHETGFTLLELMIVTAVIAVLAGIMVPSLMASRTSASQGAIVATMRTIASAQSQCRANATVDLNGNGAGECASLAELAGAVVLRGQSIPLSPPLLSASLGNLDADGHVLRSGYLMALYLPDAAGNGLVASAANLPLIDPTQAELWWTCIAWPASREAMPGATFFVNQSAEILFARNTPYTGKTSVPPPGCALVGVPPNSIASVQTASNSAGADGFTWLPLR